MLRLNFSPTKSYFKRLMCAHGWMRYEITWWLKITKRIKSRGVSLDVAQVLLCQVGSRDGIVLYVYIESSWFLVSWLVCRLIPGPGLARPLAHLLFIPAQLSLPRHASWFEALGYSSSRKVYSVYWTILQDDLQVEKVSPGFDVCRSW